jgi:hypothetical protein
VNPVISISSMLSGFPPEFTLAKAGAGMTTFYENIKIYDIEKGKDFDCKLWLEGPNKSEVR